MEIVATSTAMQAIMTIPLVTELDCYCLLARPTSKAHADELG
jgi:hypothetical protein